MTVNSAGLQFYSGYPIDKIVTQGTFSIAVPKASSNIAPSIVTTSRPNPYGQAGFTTVSFSVDNVNFYEQTSNIIYWNSTNLESDIQMTVTSACDASSIYFLITSYYIVGAQTAFINYTIDTVS